MSRPGAGAPDDAPAPQPEPSPAQPPNPESPGAEPGRLIVRASLGGTVLFVVTAGLAAAVGGGPLRGVAAVVAVAMFAVGSLAYLVGYARAIQRSRTRIIAMSGLVFLSDCAPAAVRRKLLGATGVQVIAALVTASIRPFTSLAFGVLAPVFGLGLQSLWAARHGEFPARPPERRRPGASGPGTSPPADSSPATSSPASSPPADSSPADSPPADASRRPVPSAPPPLGPPPATRRPRR